MGETENQSFSLFLDVSLTPQSYYVHLCAKTLQIFQEKVPNLLMKYYLGKSQHVGHRTFWNLLEKAGAENPDDPSGKFLKILNMGLISWNLNKSWIILAWEFGIS